MTAYQVREDATQPRTRPTTSPIAESMRCPEPGCGRPAAGSQAALGEVVVYVGGSGAPSSIFCGGSCASRWIARLELHHHLPPDQRPRDLHTAVALPTQPTADLYRGVRGTTAALYGRKARIEAAGATISDVRAWAVTHGLHVGSKGVPTETVVAAFLAARGVSA